MDRYTLMGLIFAGIKFRGSAHPRNFKISRGLVFAGTSFRGCLYCKIKFLQYCAIFAISLLNDAPFLVRNALLALP